jgi:hypothetical protein
LRSLNIEETLLKFQQKKKKKKFLHNFRYMIDIIYSGNGNVTQSEGWNFGLISSGGWLKLLVCDGDKEKRGTNGPDYGGCCMDLL